MHNAGLTPLERSQSVTIEKENTKQSNANSISQCVVSIGNVWVSVMYSKE